MERNVQRLKTWFLAMKKKKKTQTIRYARVSVYIFSNSQILEFAICWATLALASSSFSFASPITYKIICALMHDVSTFFFLLRNWRTIHEYEYWIWNIWTTYNVQRTVNDERCSERTMNDKTWKLHGCFQETIIMMWHILFSVTWLMILNAFPMQETFS